MKITSRILFSIALIISAFLLSLIFLVISNSKFLDVSWLEITDRFQTLLGGFGVLVAGLFAYCASTLEVYETKKNNKEDKIKQKNDVHNSVAMAVEILRQQSHSHLEDIKRYSDNYTCKTIHIDLLKTLKISIPQQLSIYYKHSSLFSNNVHRNITTLIGMATLYTINHPIFIKNTESSMKIEKKNASIRRKMKIKIENLSSTTTEEEKSNADEEYVSALIAAKHIGWQRATSALEPINRAALEIMKILEPTKDWTFDPAPYPPADPNTSQKPSNAKHPTL